jgi:hypothetical protein
MKAGNRGLSKTENGKTVKMTIDTVCPNCGKTYAIKSDVPMKDQRVCQDCR